MRGFLSEDRAESGSEPTLFGRDRRAEAPPFARQGISPMKSVASILKSKPDPTVYAIAPTASVFDALKLMAEKSIGALVVMEGEQVVGVITERDYARKV